MKNLTRLLLFQFSVFSILAFSSGCACPHRKALASHTIEAFLGRPDGLIARETWRDQEGGGGFFLFTDPTVQSMAATHTNQRSLGGGSVFSTGPMNVLVDSNLAPAITASGTAVGNVIGAAAKAAVK
jgi:hypothetical protein